MEVVRERIEMLEFEIKEAEGKNEFLLKTLDFLRPVKDCLVVILKQELERRKAALEISNGKLELKKELATAAMAAEAAAEKSLQLAGSGAAGLHERIEELRRQLEVINQSSVQAVGKVVTSCFLSYESNQCESVQVRARNLEMLNIWAYASLSDRRKGWPRGPGQGGPRRRTGLELPSRENVVSEQAPDDPNYTKRLKGTGVGKRLKGTGVGRVPIATRVLLESGGGRWGRVSGLNGTKVDKGFSIPHLTRKGSIRGTSAACHAACHAACTCLASNMMNLGKAFGGCLCVQVGECIGKLVANMLLKCLHWANATNGVWALTCEGV
ncbi:hypothetical protein GH714_027488 [Hevea brasiliensis]|uniref:Uncharacterized protein n=1 Tax=Hevea brasiliensis TaxID=3981 RepID=A0A6A6N789_HEVBR|nr:hypothetical protein GH714_027488 [Hevea brasiliensis]